MTLTIIGAGYVGLVTASVFSEIGNKVYCVDIDQKRIDNLKKNKAPFFEPGLEDYITRNQKSKKLIFTTSYSESVPNSDIVLICVGTPPQQTGQANLTYLFQAVEQTAKNLKGYTLITIKSTIPVGFEDDLEKIANKFSKQKVEFSACPEFLREGTAIEDTLHPNRIVIGSHSEKAKNLLLTLHAPISGERITCDIRSAQLIKYASNALLATKVSFANSIARICENTGADVEKVLLGVGMDTRLGRSFLNPGIGYGGSCLPKDVSAFVAIGKQFGFDFRLLEDVNKINEDQIEYFVNKIVHALNQSGKKEKDINFKVGVLGLSFKPNTDDIRESPAVKIINLLRSLRIDVDAYDPQAIENAKKNLKGVTFSKDEYETANGKDALILATEWPQFLDLDFEKIKKSMKTPLIIDGRNALNEKNLKQLGFRYIGVGR